MRKFAIITSCLCIGGILMAGLVAQAGPDRKSSDEKKKCEGKECAKCESRHLGKQGHCRHRHGRHGPHGGLMKMMGVGPLLRIEAVRVELKIDDEQLERLKALREELHQEIREQMHDLFGSLRDLPPEVRREKMGEIHEQGKVIREKVEDRLQEVLKPEQFQRLKQIGLQARLRLRGARALTSGEIANALELTDEQKKDLRDRAKQARKEAKEQIKQQIREIREAAKEKVKEGLTSEQQEKLETMLGPKFDLPKELLDRHPPGHHGKRGHWGKGRQPGRHHGPPEGKSAETE